MDQAEFHKRAKSYIKPIGPDQERKLKEFLVPPPRCFRFNARKCRLTFLDSTIKMKDLLPCANISRNVKETGKIGIGKSPR